MATTATRTIFINGKEAENTLKGLTELATRFRNEMRNATIGTQDYKDAFKGWREANQALNQHNTHLRSVSGAYTNIQQGLSGIAGYAAAAFSVNSLITFGKEALTAANNFEQTNIAFQTMLGSKKDADILQAQLIELAAKTPFELPQVQQATKQLLAYGFSAQEVIPNLTALGNIAAGVGQEKLPQLILAFGQVKAATKLTGNELRQFTEAGVPLLDELAKQMKKPVAEIQKMVSEGEIGFPIVQKAMIALTSEGGRFANLMEKQSQSLGGVWSTFKDTFTQNVLLPIGNRLTPVVKGAIGVLTELGGTSSKFDQMRRATEAERNEVGILVNRIRTLNISNTERSKLIGELQKQYPNFLGNLNAEKVTNEQLATRLQEVNKQYLAKIVAIEVAKKVETANNLETQSVEFQGKAQVRQAESLAKAQDFLGDKTLSYEQAKAKLNERIQKGVGLFAQERVLYSHLVGDYQTITVAEGLHAKATQNTNNEKLKQSQILENLKKQFPEIAADLDNIINPKAVTFNDKAGGGGDGLSKKDKKDIESDEKKLAKLRENLVNYQNDIKQLEDSEYKEQLKTIEKYEKQIAEVKKLYDSKDRETRIGAVALVKELEALKNKELEALTQKHLDDIQAEFDKHQKELDNKKLSEDKREDAEIADKYTKRIKAAQIVENAVGMASEAQRQKAHELRLKLEAQRDEEIAAARTKRNTENQLKEDKEWQEKQLATATEQDREVLEVIFHYQNILDKQKLSEEERARIAEEMGLKIGTIKKKHRDKEIKDEKEKAEILIGLQKELAKAQGELELAKLNAAEKGIGILRGFAGQSTALAKALFVIEKGVATAQIVKNLQIEVQALRVAAAIQSAAVAAIPGAPAAVQGIATAKIAAARINAGVSIATIAAQSIGSFVQQKADGGFVDITGATDNRRYQAQPIGSPQTGLLDYANPVLLQSATGQPILANEKGREFFVSSQSLQNPQIAYLVRIIDNLQRNNGAAPPVMQRETGGYTTNTTADIAPLGSGAILAAIERNTKAVEALNRHLDDGIKAETVIGYPTIVDITKAQTRLAIIEG